MFQFLTQNNLKNSIKLFINQNQMLFNNWNISFKMQMNRLNKFRYGDNQTLLIVSLMNQKNQLINLNLIIPFKNPWLIKLIKLINRRIKRSLKIESIQIILRDLEM
ncbi:unnamed protein product [Paramecium pentaurelia]|uniref:Uncharacterized protein n=1 Tax=Paramecium pentaurelia TaxID=43138 RepID=A0A8S1TY03_9CILI|nr:unnamed protein product [Paramecium pentaurelia]